MIAKPNYMEKVKWRTSCDSSIKLRKKICSSLSSKSRTPYFSFETANAGMNFTMFEIV
jgi:hypothetical protein